MKNAKNEPIATVPTRVLKGKDGREPFAEKVAKVKEILEKAELPKEFREK